MQASCYCSYNFTCGVCLLNAAGIAPVVFNPPATSPERSNDMSPAQALAIISALANGVNPADGSIFPFDHILHNADVVRALYTAVRVLQRTRIK